MRFDVDRFEERAAISEFDGGATRFAAETMAAQEQGLARWQALKLVKEARDAQRGGHSSGGRDTNAQMARKQRSQCMPSMQQQPEEEARPVSVGQQAFGRPGVALLALRNERRGVV